MASMALLGLALGRGLQEGLLVSKGMNQAFSAFLGGVAQLQGFSSLQQTFLMPLNPKPWPLTLSVPLLVKLILSPWPAPTQPAPT